MNWITSSLIMFFFSVFQYLLIRKIQKDSVSNKIINFMMFFPAVPILLIWVLLSKSQLILEGKYIILIALITFLFSYLGNRFSLSGIKSAPNPGFSLIIQKSYAVYTAFAAVVLFDSTLSLGNLISITIIILFSATIVIDRSEKKKDYNWKWIAYSIIAFFLFGNLALASKYFQLKDINPTVLVFYVFFFVSIFFFADLLLKGKSIKYKLKKSNVPILALIGISNGFFNLATQFAFKTSPNIGYVNIINTASITAITLLSTIFFKDKLTLEKIIGVIGVTLGLILLLLN